MRRSHGEADLNTREDLVTTQERGGRDRVCDSEIRAWLREKGKEGADHLAPQGSDGVAVARAREADESCNGVRAQLMEPLSAGPARRRKLHSVGGPPGEMGHGVVSEMGQRRDYGPEQAFSFFFYIFYSFSFLFQFIHSNLNLNLCFKFKHTATLQKYPTCIHLVTLIYFMNVFR
jgi:hypothetical protein